MPELREIFPELTKSQREAVKSIDRLCEELLANQQFRSELVSAVGKRGQLMSVRVSFGSRAVERAVRLMHIGTPEAKANPNRAIENIVVFLILGAIEEAKNGK